MTYIIYTPAGSDRYSLTSDLRTMADQIAGHLQTVDNKTAGAIKSGQAVSLSTVTTTSAPTFPGITITGSVLPSSVVNDAVYGFGLRSSNIYLTTKNKANWVSNAHIVIPDGGTTTQAINRNALDVEKNALQAQITSLTSRVAAIEAVYASEGYVDGKTSTLTSGLSAANANISSLTTTVNSKANYYQALDKVLNAQNAVSATNATNATTATNAGYATTAGDSPLHAGRKLAVGRQYFGSLVGDAKAEMTITHGLGYTPVVIASAYGDDGVMSITCSIGSVGTNTAEIKLRNLNNTGSEIFSVNWIAI